MNFEYNETQAMIAQSIRDFAEQHIRPHIMEWDEAQIFPVDLFKKLGEMGYMGFSRK
jgi:alkylation response protein AidB-like acyl-CoA dehydrogenase